jgi:hypothetical protein
MGFERRGGFEQFAPVAALRFCQPPESGVEEAPIIRADALERRTLGSGEGRLMGRLGLIVLVAVVLAHPAAAQDFRKLDFITGCWQGALSDGAVVEEIWTQPSENVMLGLTRYLDRNRKRVTNWEFTFIERTDSTVYFVPQTRGEKPDTFRVRVLTDEVAAWNREGDDYPASIMYRRTSDGAIIARLEPPAASAQSALELRMTRVKCPGA